jgi:hypothetical protein
MMFAILLLCISGIASAQGKNEGKITNAIERAKRATAVLKQVAALPDDKGIPKEVREKMNLVGVIPNALRLSLLFSKGYRGYGLSSLKKDGVWSAPAFYFFGASFGVSLTGVDTQHPDIVMAVVNAPTEVKKKDKTKPKPKKDDPAQPRAYIYTFADGTLKTLGVIRTSWLTPLTGAGLNIVYDDNLNEAVYAAKGDEVLTGGFDKTRTVPNEITGFRDAVQELFPQN